ncbi:MAG: glycosyltransferase family 39 protein [Bacteroidota bacterium]
MSQKNKYSLLWVALGGLLFLPGLGQVHLFDWDEINFAEISREMIALEDYMRVYVNYEPFWEKPPLFFWIQAMSMQLFGINEFAARLPNAICGMLTLVILYRLGYFLRGHLFGMLWAGGYLGSILPHLYFRSGILDPWFNLFIFLGLCGLIAGCWKRKGWLAHGASSNYRYLVVGGFCLGLAVLIKGPAAWIIVGLTALMYLLLGKFKMFISVPQTLLFVLFAVLPPTLWLGIETWSNGPWFAEAFTRYQYRLFTTSDAGHKGFFGFHLVILLFGCFPASIYALRGFGLHRLENKRDRNAWFWMTLLLFVVLFLFTAVQSKIVHYSSMCYFPLTYLAALGAFHLIGEKTRWRRWMSAVFWLIGGLIVLVCLAAPIVAKNIDWLRPFLAKDAFALGNLDAQIDWPVSTFIPGVFLLAVMVVFFRLQSTGAFRKAVGYLFAGSAFFIFLSLAFFIKRVEGYSQRAAIAFYESLEGKDVYVMTYGFKSYAHIYYFDKPIPGDFNPRKASQGSEMSFQQHRSSDPEWLLYGDIDKDVYIATKITKVEQLLAIQGVTELYRSNGFVFCKRPHIRL